jgi:hypothetical protein
VTHSEPERLALELQQLIERRTRLRGILGGRLQKELTSAEKADLLRVIDQVDTERAMLERRLADLLGGRKD